MKLNLDIQNTIDKGLQFAMNAKALNGENWMFKPEVTPLSEERIESRFDTGLPVLKHLDTALDLAANHQLAVLSDGLRGALDRIRWSQNPSYTADNTDRSFLDGYAYAGLAGPDCPIRCEVPRVGFVLLGPGVEYTDHQHEPREFYIVLTPGSQWKLDKTEWFDVNPGDLILHSSWQWHAMRTHAEPLLAFAGWLEQGDRREINI